jgi:uncharacterized membrane protein
MKKIIILCSALLLAACNIEIKDDSIPTSKIEALTNLDEETDSAITKTEVTTNAVTIQSTATTATTVTNTARIMANSKAFLIARDSEPGWYVEFYKDGLRLLANYGKDSLIVNQDLSMLENQKKFTLTLTKSNFNGNAKFTSDVLITVEEKACTEAGSGEKREQTITLKYNAKTYKGCATN